MTRCFTQGINEIEKFIDFFEEDAENIRRVIEFVKDEGLDAEFILHGKAETVEESAENTGVEPRNVVKTLIFSGERPVAVLCPGNTSVAEEKLEEVLGSEVRMATPEEVTEATGYTVGGVSPFDLEIPVYIEEEILERDEVKPAAGSRVLGLKVDPEALKEAVDAEAADIGR
ncbi:MAG: aminoacyl-tRNA deacylase [Candidatus Nanohaloarchaea archaeon]